MTKKSLNKKEAIKAIQSKLMEGKQRQEILDELSEIYYDKSTIAKLIAVIPDQHTKEKYKIFNDILLGLLFLTIVFKVIIGIALFSNISFLLIPIAFALPVISILFAIEVARFRGHIYNILGLLAIVSILNVVSDLGETGTLGLIDIGIALAIAGLSFYLANKMFPNYGLVGPKKDAEGDIILG